MVFAISGHFDSKRRSSNESNEYYYLAKACLRLASRRENTLAYLQTLVRNTLTLVMGSTELIAPNQIHMSQYLHFSGAESASWEVRWEYLSQAVRISYKVSNDTDILHPIRDLRILRWGYVRAHERYISPVSENSLKY